jgi:hypothetical protein
MGRREELGSVAVEDGVESVLTCIKCGSVKTREMVELGRTQTRHAGQDVDLEARSRCCESEEEYTTQDGEEAAVRLDQCSKRAIAGGRERTPWPTSSLLASTGP